jgi:hypothetical protein
LSSFELHLAATVAGPLRTAVPANAWTFNFADEEQKKAELEQRLRENCASNAEKQPTPSEKP